MYDSHNTLKKGRISTSFLINVTIYLIAVLVVTLWVCMMDRSSSGAQTATSGVQMWAEKQDTPCMWLGQTLTGKEFKQRVNQEIMHTDVRRVSGIVCNCINILMLKRSFNTYTWLAVDSAVFFLASSSRPLSFMRRLLPDFPNHQLIINCLEDILQYSYRCKKESISIWLFINSL